MRSSPACASAGATRARPIALVVRLTSGRGRSAVAAATMPTSPGRSSGSPPVKRTSRMPSCSTPMRTSRAISSSVRTSTLGSQSRPSGGMQYEQRRLQRSVSDTRRSVATRPCRSTSPPEPGATGTRTRGSGSEVEVTARA